ncbi:hypothetical protein TRFO_19237 [Tritrichomonas foetus]|uniref:Uncharacterized protein n=1 Tax=Tritrichomonas foetus TaxID=1144522 RepID=A0A1J4KK74_9EUKA|nr:hypothetical protein TRFO_19237 [Tritrichomonas foetus]|eukprot:OHT11352.1 hypothetical protein TRFO_19237 [Tritrichomonas foetus]
MATSSPVSPDLADYEARSARMKNLLMSGSRRTNKKKDKKVDNNNLEHVKFQREVDAGYYKPTPEEVDQLVLIPHFENVHFHDFGLVLPHTQKKPSELRKHTCVPPGLTREQYEEIREAAAQRAKEVYSQAFPETRERSPTLRRLVTDESAENLLSLEAVDIIIHDESYEVLRRAVVQLSKEVESIENQNKILLAHLQLLDKAQQMLDVTAKCSIEAIQWEKQKIQEHYYRNPNASKKRRSHRRKHLYHTRK